MPESQFQITREGMVLGSLPEGDVRELLAMAFLKPEDVYWCEGMPEPKPLRELGLPGPANGPPAAVIRKARGPVALAATAITGAASQVTAGFKSLTSVTRRAASRATTTALLGYLGQLRQLLASLPQSRPVAAVRAGVRDQELMRKVFGAMYDCLPRPICRFVREEQFIAFCMEHRDKLTSVEKREPPP